METHNPFAVTPHASNRRTTALPFREDDFAMTSGAREVSRDLDRAAQRDPAEEAMKQLTQRKTQIGHAKRAAEQMRDKFLETEGNDLFERDPTTNKVLENPDGSYIPRLGSEIDSLRAKSSEKVGRIRGALTPAVHGDMTPDAIAARSRLAEVEPIYQAKMSKFQRIQEQIARIEKANNDTEAELGTYAQARLKRDSGLDLGMETEPAAAAQPPPQGSSVVERGTNNPRAAGSTPAPAPISTPGQPASSQTLPATKPDAAATASAPVSPVTAPVVTPNQLVRMHRQMKDAEEVAAMVNTGENTKAALLQKSQRLREMFVKGMAALPSDGLRQRVVDNTRDPTVWELVKNFTGRAGEGAGTGLVDMGEFVLRNLNKVTTPAGSYQDIAAQQAQQNLAEFSDAMREEAAGWGLGGVPKEVAEKLAETFSGKLGQGLGSTASFMVPTTAALRLSQIMGASTKLMKVLAVAVPGLAGAAQSGNALRREAAVNLEQMVAAGEMSEEEATLGINQAELIGVLSGLTESASPLGRWSKKIAGVPAGQTFLKELADKVGTGGMKAVTQWMRGNGRRFILNVVSEAGEEAFQELAQGYIENRAARGEVFGNVAFDPKRDLGDGLAEGAAVGGSVGAIVSALLGGYSGADVKRQKRIAEAMKRGAEAKKAGAVPVQPAAAAPAPGAATPANQPAAPVAAQPAAAAEPETQKWTFSDKQGKQHSVEATGLRDALAKLPEAFKPNLKVSPKQEPIIKAAASTPSALRGEQIDKEWTAFSPESQSLGIPRAEMPQIKAEHRGALTQFLKGRGIVSEESEVLPGELKPTQAEFSPGKVAKAREFKGGDRAILVSSDNHVVDGHHQWMAKLTDKPDEWMRVIRLDAPIADLLNTVKEFPSVKAASGATEAQPTSQPQIEQPGPSIGGSQKPKAAAGAARPSLATRTELLTKIEAAINDAPAEADFVPQATAEATRRPGFRRGNAKQRQEEAAWVKSRARQLAAEAAKSPQVTIQSGSSQFTVKNTKEVLERLQKALRKQISDASIPSSEGSTIANQDKVKANFKSAKTDAERRSAMDQMTPGTLKQLGLADHYERFAPGVTLTRAASQALRELKAGRSLEIDVEASMQPGDSEFDPSAPAALAFRDATEGEYSEGIIRHVQEFADILNSERRRIGKGSITLTAQSHVGTYNHGSHLNSDGASADSGAQRFIRGIENALKKRVVFVRVSEPVSWEAVSSPQRANTILVRSDASSPIAALIGHELAHNLKAQNPDLYRELRTVVYSTAGVYSVEYEKIKRAQGYASEKIEDEWVADVIGQRFDEPEFWRDVQRTAESQGKSQEFAQLARSAWEWLTELLRRVRRVFTRETDQTSIKQIGGLRRGVAQVLFEFQAQMPDGGYAENPIAGRREVELATVEASQPVRGSALQERILNKVTGTLEDKRTFKEKVGDYLAELGDYIQRELQQKILDRFNAIKRLERATIGTNDMDASISAYKWSRLTGNLAGVMEYLMKHGQMAYRNGSMEMVKDSKGLVDILRPVVESGKLRLWEGYVAAFRANRLLAEGKEKNFGKFQNPTTGEWEWSKDRAQEEINALLELSKDHPEFEQVRQDYVAFQKAVLDVATAAGLIDPAKRALWERSDYVPFYRIVDALDNKDGIKGPRGRRGFSGQSAGIRQLKGGPQQVAILENIFRNIEQMVDASFKNIAMQRIADLAGSDTDLIEKIPHEAVPFKATVGEAVATLDAAGVDTSALQDGDLNEVVKFWRSRAPEGTNIAMVMNQGTPVYYRVNDPYLLRSILALGPDRHTWWMRMLMAPKHGLTWLVTMDPAFMAANTIRDSFSAWVIADTPIKPGFDTMKGFVKSMNNDPVKLSVMVNGGGTGHYNRMKESEVRRGFMRMTREQRDGFLNSIIDTPGKLARLYRDIGRSTENANRLAIAESAAARGASPAEAAFQALDIMDFGLRGDSKALAFFLDTVPFMNARIQGLYRLGRGLMNNPKRVATHGAVIMGATLALLASNWDDERYWALPEWERDLYYHLWLGGRHVRIPKPFEVGQIFSTMPERMLQFLAKDGDSKIFARRILSMIGDTFAMNPIPQAIRPLVERATNTNLLTWNRIISRGDEFKTPEEQFSAYTSATAREIAQAMPDNAPEWLRSPKTLDFMIRGYFGTLGMYALDAADAMVKPAAGYPEDVQRKIGDYWLVRRFSPESDLRDSKYVSEFYELNGEIQQVMAKVKALREQGDIAEAAEVQAENRDLLAYAPVTKSTEKALAALRKRERDIYNKPRGMTPEQRREELARIAEQQNRLTRQAVTRAPGRPEPLYNPFGINWTK